MKNLKAKAFAEALKEYDKTRADLDRQLKAGKISQDEYHRLLTAKSKELDL